MNLISDIVLFIQQAAETMEKSMLLLAEIEQLNSSHFYGVSQMWMMTIDCRWTVEILFRLGTIVENIERENGKNNENQKHIETENSPKRKRKRKILTVRGTQPIIISFSIFLTLKVKIFFFQIRHEFPSNHSSASWPCCFVEEVPVSNGTYICIVDEEKKTCLTF